MTRHLCISVTLLDPLFHGKGDSDEPEWPPSPMRLFQALVAGSRSGCRNAEWSETKAEAYRWLERRNPPLIVGPPARPAAAYTLFVPNNDADKKFERQERLTDKSVRPHRMVNDGPKSLHYAWAIAEDEWFESRSHAELLCGEARHLTALGWGIDQAVAQGSVLDSAEVGALAGQQWRAWKAPLAGSARLRVPEKGSLDDLKRAYEAFQNRLSMELPPKAREPRVFGTRVYLPAGGLPTRPSTAFELPEGVAFRQEDAVAVAAMLRSLACRCAKDDSHQFPGGSDSYVAGHRPRRGDGRFVDERWPRFSYLPLPSIGHEHADGMIRRLLIVEPIGGDGSHAGWAQQRLRNQILRDHDGIEWGVLLDRWRQSSSRMLDLYVAEQRAWSSVTPVILPGFDDGKRTKADRLFLQAVQQAGLPVEAISDFTLRKAPFRIGLHPNQYRRPDYLDSGRGRRFSAWHVHLSFRDPVAGPITIGAGRHVGLGVLATVDDAAQQQHAADGAGRRR